MAQDIVKLNSQSSRPANQQRPIRVLQITDCHLHTSLDWKLAGINTQISFEWVMALAAQQKSQTDLLLLTGDLVHDASAVGYTRLRNSVQEFGIKACCLPGNHDNPEMLTRHMRGGLVEVPKEVKLGNWVIIMLDSTQPHSEGGHLSDRELQTLERSLRENTDRHALIALHHHPVHINSAWMDKMALDNPEPFLSILDHYDNAKGVIWGHIHQPFDAEHNGVRMMGTPSTCIQFIENQDKFGISTAPPGFRWLELLPDGGINSGIDRIAALPPGLDLKTAGY
ncbi:3',5'-cyclic-AMP phosphodiesterase [Sedimenticola selenatireducens]|uniref:3',5'-cyclic-AMP phosphodiesterase n=1 Tax=Sedimenticola selenatireducens TaxID=191960 RepID=UPI0004AFCE45|nr:3',5'-cyclic-AMP phosphodiesterase [Sedimenticola selenatireducens]